MEEGLLRRCYNSQKAQEGVGKNLNAFVSVHYIFKVCVNL